MMSLKLWYDIRRRFYASLAFFALIAALHVAVFPFLRVVLGDWTEGVPVLDSPEVRRLAESYPYYTGSRWYGEIERSALFGILLALGGVMAEGRTRAALITLSLPVSRAAWIAGQLAASLAAVFALNLAGNAIVAAGGTILGQPIPVSQAVLGAVLISIAVLPYLAVTLLASAYTGERLMAAVAAVAFLIFTNKLDYLWAVDPWLPESLMSVLTHPGFPWKPVVSITSVTAAALAGAIREFQRADF